MAAPLTDTELKFIKDLIAIRSVGGAASDGMPYGEGPLKALTFFLNEARSSGMRTGVLANRVGWCEIGPEDSDKMFGIVCHLDVVPVGDGWETDPFVLTEVESVTGAPLDPTDSESQAKSESPGRTAESCVSAKSESSGRTAESCVSAKSESSGRTAESCVSSKTESPTNSAHSTKLAGRGIIDDKGPAASAFIAMKRLLNEGYNLKTRVRLILGTDEERTCSCVEYYGENGEIPTFAITPDAEFPVIYAEKGIMNILISGPAAVVGGSTNSTDSTNSTNFTNIARPTSQAVISVQAGSAANMVPASAEATVNGKTIKATGRTAHASKPELGVNAIYELCKKLDEDGFNYDASPLMKFIRNDLAPHTAQEYTGCAITDESGIVTANPSVLNINNEGESLIIDVRCPVSYEMEKITEHLSTLAAPYGLKCETKSAMDPVYKDKNLPEIKILTDIWKTAMPGYTGFKPEYIDKYTTPLAIGGGTYARHLPNTIAFGLQTPWMEDLCHQANESRAVQDIENDIEVLKETIKRLTEKI